VLPLAKSSWSAIRDYGLARALGCGLGSNPRLDCPPNGEGMRHGSKVNDEIRECDRLAEECWSRAQEATDQVVRAELSEMRRRWLYLARSFEFTERIALTLRRWREGGVGHDSMR
jgi:hypothetical protein